MSKDPLFPQDEEVTSQVPSDSEKSEFKRPDLIILDDEQEKQGNQDKGASFEEQQAQSAPQSSISLRFFCVLGLIFCLVFGLGIFLWALILTFLTLVTFLQNHQLNRSVKTFWRLCLNTLIAGLGFTIGIISPTIGLGLLVLYFSLTGEVVDNHLLRKILRRSFNNL
jgi:ABC-type Fe3+ transport system permease subunit